MRNGIAYETLLTRLPDTLGFVISKHRDWFDEQDTEANALLQSMHSIHLAYINDKHSPAKRTAYCKRLSALNPPLFTSPSVTAGDVKTASDRQIPLS